MNRLTNMDQNEDQKLQHIEKYNKFHFLKRTLHLLVCVSLFSLVLCYYDFSLLLHSFNTYFSTILFSFFTHTLERKYMFLICNVGILAFLAKNSVSCSSSTEMKASSFLNEEVSVGVGSLGNVAIVAEEQEKQKDKEEEAAVAKEAEEQEQNIWSSYGEENERNSEALIAENEGKEEESVPLMKQEVEPDAASEASTDELNKKFEEFIRKMKEELRIQARRQLIAV